MSLLASIGLVISKQKIITFLPNPPPGNEKIPFK